MDRSRQAEPHAHGIYADADDKFVYVPDLGLDQVLIYAFDPGKGTLTPNDPAFAKIEPGSGPRHFAFHPAGGFAYVINEMGNTIVVFKHDADTGALEALQTIPTLPPDFTGSNTTAEIFVHPNGRFVYGSNRGHDSIAVFAVEEGSGKLKLVGHTPTGGKAPRNFAIDPTGHVRARRPTRAPTRSRHLPRSTPTTGPADAGRDDSSRSASPRACLPYRSGASAEADMPAALDPGLCLEPPCRG